MDIDNIIDKIKKCFILTYRILNNDKVGLKIFNKVIGNNYIHFTEFFNKNENIFNKDRESNKFF